MNYNYENTIDKKEEKLVILENEIKRLFFAYSDVLAFWDISAYESVISVELYYPDGDYSVLKFYEENFILPI